MPFEFNLFACTDSLADCNDWATLMLTRIFEDVVPFVTGASPQPTDTRFLGEIFRQFNVWLFVIAGAIASYVTFVGVANTANDGKALGGKWSSTWVPVRILVASAALVPLSTGFSGLQIGVIAIALMGSNAANYVNTKAMEKVAIPAGFDPDISITQASSDGNLIANAFMQGVCAGIYGNYYIGSGAVGNANPKVKSLSTAFYKDIQSISGGWAAFSDGTKYFSIKTKEGYSINDDKYGISSLDPGINTITWGVGYMPVGHDLTGISATVYGSVADTSFNAVCGSITARRRQLKGFNGGSAEFLAKLKDINDKVDKTSRELANSLYAGEGFQNDAVFIGKAFVRGMKTKLTNCGTDSASTGSTDEDTGGLVSKAAENLSRLRDRYAETFYKARASTLGCNDPFVYSTNSKGEQVLVRNPDTGKDSCSFNKEFESIMKSQLEQSTKYGWVAASGWFHEIASARTAVANALAATDIENKVPNSMPAMGTADENRCLEQIFGAASDVVRRVSLGGDPLVLAAQSSTADNTAQSDEQAESATAKKIMMTSTAIASSVIRALSPRKETWGKDTGMLSQQALTAETQFRKLAFTERDTDNLSAASYRAVSWLTDDVMRRACATNVTGIGNALYKVQCLADVAVSFVTTETASSIADFIGFKKAGVGKAIMQGGLGLATSAVVDNTIGEDIDMGSYYTLWSAAVGGSLGSTVQGIARNAHSIIKPAVWVSVLLPMLPYFVFMFGVLGWVLGILQTVVAAPLWAVLHMAPGQSFIGGERQGYLLLLALAVRPALLIISLYLGFWICDTFIDYYAAGFIKSLDAISSTASGINAYGALQSAAALLTGSTSQLSILFLTFCVGTISVFLLVFSLTQTLPNAVLRWININNEDLGASHGADILKQRMQSAAGVGGYHGGSEAMSEEQTRQFGRQGGGQRGKPQ